jgi:hypothetical protein
MMQLIIVDVEVTTLRHLIPALPQGRVMMHLEYQWHILLPTEISLLSDDFKLSTTSQWRNKEIKI